MFRAMATKELRQTGKIALLGLLAYGLMIAALVDPNSHFELNPFVMLQSGQRQSTIPFVNDVFFSHFCWVSAAIAIILAIAQTFGESTHGTYLLLFHRPATRRWLIGAKLVLGLSVYLVCGAIPILLFGWWAATPGNHASPFEWSMTVPSWIVWFGMTVLYLGAFLTGLRPGRWSRSRLLPLAAAGAMVFFTFLLGEAGNVGPLWQLLVLIVADLWIIATIFFVAWSRDYP